MFDWLFNRCKHYNRKAIRGYHTQCVDCEKEFGREGRDFMRKVHFMRFVVLTRAIASLSQMCAERADNMTTMRDLDTAAKWQKLAGRTNRLAQEMDELSRDVFDQTRDDAKLTMFQ